jgi:hypothetical protein
MTHVTILTRAGQGPRPYRGLLLNGHFSFLGKLSGVDADKLRRLVWYPKPARLAQPACTARSLLRIAALRHQQVVEPVIVRFIPGHP